MPKKYVLHHNKHIGVFPIHEMCHFHVSGSGEAKLNMFYAAVRKRKRADYFRRQQRMKGANDVHGERVAHNKNAD